MNAHIIYRFGDYRLDPAKRELWRGGGLLALQPKVFDSLAYLVENRDRAVGKDELIAAVWGKVDVSDATVGQIIGRARHAIGDTGEEQRAIRTINRVGYSWVLPVDAEEIEPSLSSNCHGNGPGHADAAPHANGHQALINGDHPATTDRAARAEVGKSAMQSVRGRWLAAALALAILIVFGVAAWLHQDRPSANTDAGEIALVLPVAVVGDDGASWVRLGVMDLIADRLREAGQAVVPSDNTVALARTLSGTDQPGPTELKTLTEATAATLVMEPRAEKVNGHWRVTLRTLQGREPALVAEGDADDILLAAHAAADRMNVMLGHRLEGQTNAAVPISDIDRLVQRVKADVLSDRFDEARSLLDRADAEQRADPRIRYERAMVELQAGNLAEAETAFRSLIVDVASIDDPLMHARAIKGLATVLLRRLDYPAAETHFTDAIEKLRRLDGFEARNLLGHGLMGRASVREFQRNYENVQADHARARVALESTGDQLALAKLDGNRAILLTSRTRYADAVPHAQRALERIQLFGDFQSELRMRTLLAVANIALLDAPAALAEVAHFDELLARISNPALKVVVNSYRISILFANGHLEAANELLRKELERSMPKGAETHGIWPQAVAAHQALERGDAEAAARLAGLALVGPWDKAMGGKAMGGKKANLWLTLLRAQLQMGQVDAAVNTVHEAIAWVENSADDSLTMLYMALLHAEYAASTDDDETAREHFEVALTRAEVRSVPLELLQVAEPYTNWLIRQGEFDHASVVAGRVASWAGSYYDAALLQLRLYHALGEVTAWRQALVRARALAGERDIPADLVTPPVPAGDRHAVAGIP